MVMSVKTVKSTACLFVTPCVDQMPEHSTLHGHLCGNTWIILDDYGHKYYDILRFDVIKPMYHVKRHILDGHNP
jgi:hypothetical protein